MALFRDLTDKHRELVLDLLRLAELPRERIGGATKRALEMRSIIEETPKGKGYQLTDEALSDIKSARLTMPDFYREYMRHRYRYDRRAEDYSQRCYWIAKHGRMPSRDEVIPTKPQQMSLF